MQHLKRWITVGCLCLVLGGCPALRAQQITTGALQLRAVRTGGLYTGFDLISGGVAGAKVRLSSNRLLTALRCDTSSDGRALTFSGLRGRQDTGLRMGLQDSISVTFSSNDPYPVVSFNLTIAAFDPVKWQAAVGKQPFHLLALYLRDAEVWHQRGWLNATPHADPFPLLGDVHVGTPEISGYHYNRNWSYTPPLGAHPIPVIGLWAPAKAQYVGLEFATSRLDDNSEADIATGYCWGPNGTDFAALVYPYGGTGYQQLVFPPAGTHLKSEGTLLWSLNLPATGDPNRLFWDHFWKDHQGELPRVPAVVDLSWLPGKIRLPDFSVPGETYLSGPETDQYVKPGTVVLNGWGWRNESPVPLAVQKADPAALRPFETQAETLLRSAKYFTVGGEPCVFWHKPLEGAWADQWGGAAVHTLHNANGFAAGRLYLGLYHDAGHKEYLPIVDGVFNWAKHIAWTRNEFADVPSSPFAIGGTLSASFCLDYAAAFRNAPDAVHRLRAAQAVDLARTFTYRYMVMWASDNNRFDNLDSSFLWEPNSGRDWTGAACANEVFWNLDTLAQTAVETGDPVLMWALQGSLERWHYLYQDDYKENLAAYGPADMTEGFGLYAGNVYGDGQRAHYGFASSLTMIEPVGASSVRVLAGSKAAMAFNKNGAHTEITDYRCSSPGNLAFTLRSMLPVFDLSLTVPYVDISRRPVTMIRGGETVPLVAGRDFTRPPQALWSLYLKSLHTGDRVVVGAPDENSPVLPSRPPMIEAGESELLARVVKTSHRPGVHSSPAMGPLFHSTSLFRPMPFFGDTRPDENWEHLSSWAGLQRSWFWAYGIHFWLAPLGSKSVVTRLTKIAVQNLSAVAVLYTPGEGPPPAVIFTDGTRKAVDTRLEALAWRNWPPIYTSKLLVAVVITNGKAVTGIDPGGRTVWAVSVVPEAAMMMAGASDSLPNILARLKQGSVEWQRMTAEETIVRRVTQESAALSQGSIAMLPPAGTGPAANFADRAGLLKYAQTLTAEQLVDPSSLTPAALEPLCSLRQRLM